MELPIEIIRAALYYADFDVLDAFREVNPYFVRPSLRALTSRMEDALSRLFPSVPANAFWLALQNSNAAIFGSWALKLACPSVTWTPRGLDIALPYWEHRLDAHVRTD